MQRKIIPNVVNKQLIVHAKPTDAVRLAAKLMRDRNVGCVLVMEEGSLLGIFTEGDLVTRVVAEERDPDATLIGDVMTPEPDTVSADETAIVALRRMDDSGFRHFPVVKDGAVVGVISRSDFSGSEMARMDEETALWDRIG